MSYRASFLTYIVGNYELVHEVEFKTPDCQYVLVTDNHSLTSSTWEVKYVDNPHPEDPFYLCYQIRFNPFDYVDSDIVIRCDGSMIPCGDFSPVLDIFEKDNYDMMLSIHPSRNTIYQERCAWVQSRGMEVEQANKVLAFMSIMEGYDVKNYKGLYQMNLQIERKNTVNLLANEMTRTLLKYLAADGKQTERCDQDVFSFIINKYFSNIKILPVSQLVSTSGKYFRWCSHGTNKAFADDGNYNQPYLFNKPINTVYVFE